MMTRERLDRYRAWLAEEQAELEAQPRYEPTIDWKEDAVGDLLAEVERLERAREQAQSWLDEFQGMCAKAAIEVMQWKARAEAAERDAKEAHRYAEEQIAANSRTLDEIVEILRPGETLDDAGIIEAVRSLVERR